MFESNAYPYSEEDERPELLPFVPASASRVLDVGCGLGGFSRMIKAQLPHLSIWGIEPHHTAADHAADYLDTVINGRFPDNMPSDAGHFDTIFFNDVLEHMVDPWTALRRAQSFLTPDGIVVASIPNIRHFTVLDSIIRRADFSYADNGILDRTHLRFFTKTTMIDLFTSTGFEVMNCAPIDVSTSLKAQLMTLLPWMSVDILALQYVITAKVRSTRQD
jgi:2-polyprenyl-3-methyl-5-hydroxy-6-metoxy-1,4-benzoquinol methylase